MRSLLSKITQKLIKEQKKIIEAIDITKTENEILDDFVAQNIISFRVKDYNDDQKNQNNQ